MNWRKSRKVFMTGCKVIRALALLTMLAVFPSVSGAQSQKGDWRVVESLEPGTHVDVKAQRKYACIVEGATEEQLTCWVHKRRSFHLISIAIPRAEIREVRTLPNQAKDAWIGAGIGAGAGAIAAGVQSKSNPGVNAFFGGLAGAGGGALVGAIFPIFDYLIKHGKCIYKG